jgi:hypothetical protein
VKVLACKVAACIPQLRSNLEPFKKKRTNGTAINFIYSLLTLQVFLHTFREKTTWMEEPSIIYLKYYCKRTESTTPIHSLSKWACLIDLKIIHKTRTHTHTHIYIQTYIHNYIHTVLSQPVYRTATYRCDDIRCCIIQF